jgi:hypothetical protein
MIPQELKKMFGNDVSSAISAFSKQSHRVGPRPYEWLKLQVAIAYITIPLLPYHGKMSGVLREGMEQTRINAATQPHNRSWEFYLASFNSAWFSRVWKKVRGQPVQVPRGPELYLFEEIDGPCIEKAFELLAPMTEGLDPGAPDTEEMAHALFT